MVCQQRFIDDDAVNLRTDRQPVQRAVAVCVTAQIGLVEGARRPGITQIHQIVFKRSHVSQGKTPYRKDIGQLPFLRLKPVIICGIRDHIEFKVHIRKCLL